MICELSHEWEFQAAHRLPYLPPEHKCNRLHGHGYRVEVFVRGEVQTEGPWRGMVMDTDVIRCACLGLHAQLDHRYLNDIEGLDNPTFELLARWIWNRLAPTLLGLSAVSVRETHTGTTRTRNSRGRRRCGS